MRVSVHDLYSEVTKSFEGSERQVADELLRMYPWLRRVDPADHDVPGLVEDLNATQAYDAEVEGQDAVTSGTSGHVLSPVAKAEREVLQPDETVAALLGQRDEHRRLLEAARFLAGGGPRAAAHAVRRGLWEADGDPERGALAAYAIEPSEENVKALRAVCAMTKGAPELYDQVPPEVTHVEPLTDDGQETAEAVERAFRTRYVAYVKFNGKHSAGAMLARDEDSGTTYLVKPDDDPGPAAGMHQEPVGPAARDASFYRIAEAWGLAPAVPQADAVFLDGRPHVAIKLLPWSYQGMDKLWRENPGAVRQVLQPYLADGSVHRWAVLYFVAGEVDGHAGNMMQHEGDVKLIDHGSSGAGTAFDPAGDRATWVPLFLRAWAPAGFNQMSPDERLRYLPRLGRQAETEFNQWLQGLQAVDVEQIEKKYGLDPTPMLIRLAQLQQGAQTEPADLVVNRAWAET